MVSVSKLQRWTTAVLVIAVAADATVSVLAFIGRKMTDRKWERAIAEDVEKAKADGAGAVSD